MPEREIQLKRFAFQIAQQLPDNKDDALKVIEFVKQLILWEDGGDKTPAYG